MKNLLFLLFLILVFISCNNKDKYEGKWALDIYASENDELETPMYFQIENDSIKFNYWSFDHFHKYPLEIKKDRFLFNNWSINTDLIKDTLALQHSFYIRNTNDSLMNWLWNEPITKIELPRLKSEYFNFNKINHEARNNYILFGKRIDNNQYSLQLNNSYGKINDIPAFLADTHHPIHNGKLRPFPNSILLIDKSTQMEHMEKLFLEHKKVNRLKVSLVNNINLNYHDSIGLHYNYELLNKKLQRYQEYDNYVLNSSKNFSPPPPPQSSLLFDNQKPKPQFILLKNNTLYHNDNPITTTQLDLLSNQWIENQNAIFSLYDLESSYGKFLEMTAIINSAYQNAREIYAKSKYNRNYEDLNSDEILEIKTKIPMNHIWSFSIPHYNHVVQQKNNTFGIKLPVVH